jgi:hypothetical protein
MNIEDPRVAQEAFFLTNYALRWFQLLAPRERLETFLEHEDPGSIGLAAVWSVPARAKNVPENPVCGRKERNVFGALEEVNCNPEVLFRFQRVALNIAQGKFKVCDTEFGNVVLDQ